jgi:hypothetical protein
VAAEFGGRTFLVVVGFRHLFRGLIGDRSDRHLSCGREAFAGKTSHMVKTSKKFGRRTLAVRVFRAGILGCGIGRAG